MITEIKRKFNDTGEEMTITIQLKYDDMEVFEFPESCYHCPVGFMNRGCGREVPLTYNGRPATCKLKKVSIPMPNLYKHEEK